MSLTPTLHKALLGGTSRTPLTGDLTASNELNALLATSAASETLLWQAIAASDLWDRAGYQPNTRPANATAEFNISCAPENERNCPAAAEQNLDLILRGIHPELLETWFNRAYMANASIPPRFLVKLLDQVANQPSLRQALVPLLHQRGHWLVAQNPTWRKHYGSVGDLGGINDRAQLEAQWQLGNLIDRTRILRLLRQQDPANARQKLEHDWASEPPENRAALLPCLTVGLSLDDEAFLEAALDDKRKEVRSVAQTLLQMLPNSKLMQRAIVRLQSMLHTEKEPSITKQLGGLISSIGTKLNAGQISTPTVILTLTLPDSCDKSMTRDGINQLVQHGLGEKAGWLLNLMGCVTPNYWCNAWEQNPEQVLTLMAEHEFKDALLSGLTRAICNALRFCADDSSRAWYALLLKQIGSLNLPIPHTMLPDIMQCFVQLPETSQEALVLGWLKDTNSQATQLLNHWGQQRSATPGQTLSPALSNAWLKHIQVTLARSAQHNWEVRHQLKEMAKWLNITELSYAEKNWPSDVWEHWPQWREAIDEFLETLRFRHQLEFSFLEKS